MNVQTRKQREIAERHQRFLEISMDLIEKDGFASFSMDRIAEIAEYSKGTVYQHFHCKEEVLIQLCCSCMRELAGLFQRAASFDGNHRERLLAVFFAHDLWARMHPDRLTMMQSLGADGIREKVDSESLATHDELESRLISIVSSIVVDATYSADLRLDNSLNPVELVFGLWSLSYGGQLIRSYNIPLQELGVRDPCMALMRTSSAMLDGLGWTPLSSDYDYLQSMQKIETELFQVETQQLQSTDESDQPAKPG